MSDLVQKALDATEGLVCERRANAVTRLAYWKEQLEEAQKWCDELQNELVEANATLQGIHETRMRIVS